MIVQTIQQLAGSDAERLLSLARSQIGGSGVTQNAYNIQINQQNGNAGNGIGQIETDLINGYFSAGGPGPSPNNTYITLLAALQHPLSRGTCHITTSNPLTLPAVDPHYLEKSWDLEMLVLGVKTMRKLAATPAFQKYLVSGEAFPGLSVATDDDIRTFVKKNIATEYHPIGTASMLPLGDGGVVDPTLKVYGTSNLRVADASIMPLHICAHIAATTYAIGERAATFIKDANP